MEPPHPFGLKRPALEQTYYDAFAQPNVTLVDLHEEPIVHVTKGGVRTSLNDYDLDVLVLATGFDALTGGLTSIDIRGSGNTTLRESWRDGVRTHLGVATHGFPNLLYVYGPQSPSAFCNGPTCAEVQGDWVVACLEYLRSRGLTRIEATAAAQEGWREHVQELGDASLFFRANSWYVGANVPGKTRELLAYPGGLPLYLRKCAESADAGYSGFALS